MRFAACTTNGRHCFPWQAFHKLALRLHPDKCSQAMAEDAFKKVEEAHRTITDARLRDEYDLTLPADGYSSRGASRQPAYGYGQQRASRRQPHYKWE